MKNYPNKASLIFSMPNFDMSYTTHHILSFFFIAIEWVFCEFLEKKYPVV